MPPARTCPACTTRRATGYLCRDCWFQLPADARRLLNQHGAGAIARLRQLLDQIRADVPLGQIRITDEGNQR